MAKLQKKAVKSAPEVKTVEQMRKELIDKQADLMNAKKGHRLGELTNPHILTVTRKEIARIKTAIRMIEISEPQDSAKEDK